MDAREAIGIGGAERVFDFYHRLRRARPNAPAMTRRVGRQHLATFFPMTRSRHEQLRDVLA